MKWRFFKIGALALLGVVIVLGTMAAQKSGGGGNAGNILPLKASFSEGPIDLSPIGIYAQGKIRNDSPGTWYTHQGTKAGQTQIYIYQPSTVGRLVLDIHEASGGHPVTLYFDTPLYPPVPIVDLPPNLDCVPPFFIYPVIWPSIQIEQIKCGTTFGCQRIYHTDDGGWAEIIPLTGPRDYFNFTKMRIGETKIVCGTGNAIQFTPKDLTTTPVDESIDMFALFQEPHYFTVTATDFEPADGVMDWILRPYSERYKAYTKINNVDTFVDFPLGGIPRRVTSSSYRACDHGTFIMPWELKLSRLK